MSDQLENELRRLTPLPPSPALDERIAAELNYTVPVKGAASPVSDTLLRSLLSLAAAAAVAIVFLLSTDGQTFAPPVALQGLSTGTPMLADTPRLLAQLSDAGQAISPSATNPE